ncbi:diacylglycerol kinase [Solemya elarraichensis gill symbiont]|uniref:Diacylglycerol kinase n=1 Tax=Solemya elarraichensis gill symbiont TaxID=1918949 RepID=A0A1T2KWI3_9GAMM|nr:diacylglycerol kinase [Solemya elarraichensis gill symbiont]OOZ37219.1 diacylglycerol kinase [Solemya elarraichensis gill symbiont]
MKPGNTGLTRIIKATGYSIKGIKAAYKHEAAFRQEVAASLALIPLALYLGETGVERALLLGSWLLVPLVELINSSIEAVVDRIGSEHHKLSGRAKDIGSASVALAIIWALILVPKHLT